MSHDPGTSIVVCDGFWRHIPHVRMYHRHYPEVRAEGSSLAEAASHLVGRLSGCLEFVHGFEREALERAVAEIRSFRPARPRQRGMRATPVS
jgi:hypothetical protein